MRTYPAHLILKRLARKKLIFLIISLIYQGIQKIVLINDDIQLLNI